MIAHRRRARLYLLLLVLPLAGLAPARSAAWAPTAADMPSDPAWTFGRLDNGLRYAHRANAQPAGHISLRLVVEVGFAHETPAESGLAHFVEHMVFNGTRRYPGDSLIAEMQRHGVAIGPELSAFTFLTHTLYLIDAPSSAPADLDRWFGVLREFADGATFESREVRQERKVIASELRDRESFASRADHARRRFLHPGSTLANPMNGKVDRVTRDDLRRFYDAWYRPERMLLVVVGDADPAAIESALTRHFSSLQARAPLAADRLVIAVNPPAGKFGSQHDPHIGAVAVEAISVLPAPETDSGARRRLWFEQQIALGALNRRLQLLQREHPERLTVVTAQSLMPTPLTLETSVQVQTPAHDWPFGVQTLEQELRRSLEFTFSGAEIREAAGQLLASYERAAATAPTRTSAEWAHHAVGALLWRFVLTSAEQDLALAREHLAAPDPLAISAAWRGLWQEGSTPVFAYGFLPHPQSAALVSNVFHASNQRPVEPPRSLSAPAFAYSDYGPPGEIVRREHLPALDLHLVEFANGVRLNLKRTTTQAGTVHSVARLGQGLLAEPAEMPGLARLVSQAFLAGGLGRHNPEELRRIFSGRSVQLTFDVHEDCFLFQTESSTAELGRTLETVTAYLTDAGWDQQAFAHASTELGRHLQNQIYTPEGMLGLKVYHHLSGGDTRYTAPNEHQLRSRTLRDARVWTEAQMAEAPIEIGIVGDLDINDAIAHAARTLGALPPRQPPAAPARPVTLRKQLPATVRDYRFPGEPHRAGVQVMWPLERCSDVRQSRRLEVLSAVLENRLRLKIREELGSTYVPSVNFWKSEASPDDGYFSAYLSVKPGDAVRLGRLIQRIAHQIATLGVTADEFAQAREPLLARSMQDLHSNDYWTRHIISRAQSRPEVLEWPLTREPDLRAMTPEDVAATARQYLAESRAMTFTALPLRR